MRKKSLVCVVLFLVLIGVAFGVYYYFFKEEKRVEPTVKVLESISKFNYSLDDRDTKLMKKIFEELKDNLNSDEINYSEYAKKIAELFVVDLFTMNNKLNKYDVGGSEYVYPDSVSDYKLNVENTLYKKLEDNTYNSRKQDLPEVKEIEVLDIKDTTFTYDEDEYTGYIVSLKWEYVKDFGYDNNANITLIKDKEMLYVAEYKTGEAK